MLVKVQSDDSPGSLVMKDGHPVFHEECDEVLDT
jgi:hypothetical protein